MLLLEYYVQKGKKKKNGNENSFFFAAVGKIDKESLKLKDSLKSFFCMDIGFA
jgi:hypothetical protein